tara:strand:+ start:157 stop:333 length:177 start_codon:yes stop_codon:yes gene_type:complete
MALRDMPSMASVKTRDDILVHNVRELQEQLANANIRIKELTIQVNALHEMLDAYAVNK